MTSDRQTFWFCSRALCGIWLNMKKNKRNQRKDSLKYVFLFTLKHFIWKHCKQVQMSFKCWVFACEILYGSSTSHILRTSSWNNEINNPTVCITLNVCHYIWPNKVKQESCFIRRLAVWISGKWDRRRYLWNCNFQNWKELRCERSKQCV